MTNPYIWNGKIYYGAKAVAEAAGVATSTVSSHLERQGNLDTLGIGRGRKPPRHLVWQGKTYTSVKELAMAAGVSQGYVYRLLSAHGNLERLGAGRWGGKSIASATCGREKQGMASTAVQEGATA